jgi:hypothetical protein
MTTGHGLASNRPVILFNNTGVASSGGHLVRSLVLAGTKPRAGDDAAPRRDRPDQYVAREAASRGGAVALRIPGRPLASHDGRRHDAKGLTR